MASEPMMTREEVEVEHGFFLRHRDSIPLARDLLRLSNTCLAALDRIVELEAIAAARDNGLESAVRPISELERAATAAVAACRDCGEVRLCDEDGCCLMCGIDVVVYADRHSFEVASACLADLEAQNARLTRLLAVERGDESAAPEGWRYSVTYEDTETGDVWPQIGWRNGSRVVWRGPADTRNGEPDEWVWWMAVGVTEGTRFDTALEAMEAADRKAADAAAKETPDV